MVKHKITMLVILTLVVAVVSFLGCAPRETPTWNSGTSNEGSGGYVVNLGAARMVDKYMSEKLTYVSVPTGGSSASVQLFGKGTGEIDVCYPNNIGAFKAYRKMAPFEEMKWFPYQGWYHLSSSQSIAVLANRDDINSYSDLIGKKLYPSARGMSSFDIFQDYFTMMGIWDQIDVTEVGQAEVADALNMGIIDAVGFSVISYASFVPWFKDVDARCELKIINPTPEEAALIEKTPGYGFGFDVPVGAPFTQQIDADECYGVYAMWGMMFAPYLDANLLYEMLVMLEEHTDEWVEMAPAASLVKEKGFAKLSAQGIGSVPDVPVHPGAAKWLKERGLWQDEWIIGEKIELSEAGMEKMWSLYGK